MNGWCPAIALNEAVYYYPSFSQPVMARLKWKGRTETLLTKCY